MDFEEEILRFLPSNRQETGDKKVILEFIAQFRNTVLLRENKIAHITSSGFLMNPELDKVLLIHHNIRNAWAWTGGHADGDANLLRVAIKEAKEETGISMVHPLCENVASLDILPVFGHEKNGGYVSAHLHLSVAYILICGESQTLRSKPDENTGVAWFETEKFMEKYFDASDVYLYNKLIKKARAHAKLT